MTTHASPGTYHAYFPSPPRKLAPQQTLENSSSCLWFPGLTTTPTTRPSPARENSMVQAGDQWPAQIDKRWSEISSQFPSSKASGYAQGRPQSMAEYLPSSVFLLPKAVNAVWNAAGPFLWSPSQISDGLFRGSKNSRTTRSAAPFRSQARKGTTQWQLKQFAEATLGSGSLRKAVQLPEGEDENEWLAVNIVDFYNQINLLYGSITEFCSPQSCPEMKATDEFEYLWQDSETYKKPTKMPAPEYVEHLMTWVQSNIDNEAMFPSRIGVPFPKQFRPLILQIFKRLYRVYAHIYCHHYPVIINLGLEPHLNTSFKHYVLFVDEHKLATGRDFWGPLGDLVDSMLKSD